MKHVKISIVSLYQWAKGFDPLLSTYKRSGYTSIIILPFSKCHLSLFIVFILG